MNGVERATVVAFALVALGVPASAQPETSAPTMPGTTTNTVQRSLANTTAASPPAVITFDANSKTVAAPVEAGGFSQVSGLQKDGDGIGRGQAVRDGTLVPVFCDYQGNVGAS